MKTSIILDFSLLNNLNSLTFDQKHKIKCNRPTLHLLLIFVDSKYTK